MAWLVKVFQGTDGDFGRDELQVVQRRGEVCTVEEEGDLLRYGQLATKEEDELVVVYVDPHVPAAKAA